MDFENMFKQLDPRERAIGELSQKSEIFMNRTLVALQIIYYASKLYDEKTATKMMKPYLDAINVMGLSMEAATDAFTKKYGEI